MTRFLADENVPRESVRLLRQHGHDVVAVRKGAPGASDEAVSTRARAEHRVLLTFDRDYGELIYLRAVAPPPGLNYLRLAPLHPRELVNRVLSLLNDPNLALDAAFVIVDAERTRVRPLPSP